MTKASGVVDRTAGAAGELLGVAPTESYSPPGPVPIGPAVTIETTAMKALPPSRAYKPASEQNPCEKCGAKSGWCRSKKRTVACVNESGPLSEPKQAEDGTPYHSHPRDPATGRLYEPVPDNLRRFIEALFRPDDLVLVRPIETWTEDGLKRSQPVYREIRHLTARALATDYREWAALQRVSEREKANLFFGVCPRFGPDHFDLAWQIRVVRTLWADLDHCTPADALARCEAAGLPRPSVVVNSGNGCHLYWLLDEPFLIDDAADPPAVHKDFVDQGKGKKKKVRRYITDPTTGRREYDLPKDLSPKAKRLQQVLVGIAQAIEGDHTHDAARLLRLVCTRNRKNQRNGTDPLPCELVECNPGRLYAFSKFESLAQAEPEPEPAEAAARAQIRLPTGRQLTPTRRNTLGSYINACIAAAAGDRSEADFALCCWALRRGLDREDIWTEVQGVGKFGERGREYFDRTWINAEAAVRDRLFDAACLQAGADASGPPPDCPGGQPGPAAGGGPQVVYDRIDDPHPLAQEWLAANATHPDGSTWRYFRRTFWSWDGCRYRPVADDEMQACVARFLKPAIDQRCVLLSNRYGREDGTIDAPKVTRSLVADVIQHIRARVLEHEDTPFPAWLEAGRAEPRNYLAVTNGLLDIDAALAGDRGPLRQPSPRWFSPVGLPYQYDPGARCPTWDAFLSKNLGDDSQKAVLLRQWFGYLLTWDTGHQKFLMMVGEGANGKSVACAVIRALVGDDNVSTVGLEFFGDKFHLVGTLGKLANVVAEVGDLDRMAEGQLKAFVAGDRMQFEPKFKPPFYARPTARLILATNNPPNFNDRSDGVWRRVLMLRFAIQIPEHERVRNMDQVDFWQRSGEMPGVLNWALAGLRDLRACGQFSVPASCQADLQSLRMESNPARRFLTEHYHAVSSGSVPTADLYTRYRQWCEANGHRFMAEPTFGREVVRAFKSVTKARHGPRSHRVYVYTGLAPL